MRLDRLRKAGLPAAAFTVVLLALASARYSTMTVETDVIDFVDPQLKQLVWRGWAVGVMDDPGNAAAMNKEAVGKILEKYPPQ